MNAFLRMNDFLLFFLSLSLSPILIERKGKKNNKHNPRMKNHLLMHVGVLPSMGKMPFTRG